MCGFQQRQPSSAAAKSPSSPTPPLSSSPPISAPTLLLPSPPQAPHTFITTPDGELDAAALRALIAIEQSTVEKIAQLEQRVRLLSSAAATVPALPPHSPQPQLAQ
jgi:hypothetical protein